jgi:hypothetical protein
LLPLEFGIQGNRNWQKVCALFELSWANLCTDQIYDIEEMTKSGEFSTPPEFGLVGMGIGGGFSNSEELHVLTYEQAMKSSKHREWKDAVAEEHDRLVQDKVFSMPLVCNPGTRGGVPLKTPAIV